MTGRKLSVAVVQGGPSLEAEVSRTSANAVAAALVAAGHQAVRIELDPLLAESIRRGGYDVVFPAVHGAVGEDGSLQGLLEILDLPYVGSGVLASALAFDKTEARRVFRDLGLPVSPGFSAPRSSGGGARGDLASRALDAADRAIAELGGRVVVKPARSGSAIGVSRFDRPAPREAIAEAVRAVWELDAAAVIERFAAGREVTCGVLDLSGEGARAFPPTEVHSPNDAFYTYEARYAPGGSLHVCPAPLSAEVTARVQEVALAAHHALGCRDLSRVDVIVGEPDPGGADPSLPPLGVTLLEVNTLPGFTGTSLFPEAAAVVGLAFPALCDALVESAVRRGVSARSAAVAFPTQSRTGRRT